MNWTRRPRYRNYPGHASLVALACALSVALLVSGCSIGGTYPTHPATTSSTSADAGTLYFGADGIYVLRARDGKVRWHNDFNAQDGIGNGPPALADGTLYVLLYDAPNDLAALDAQTGQVRWRVRVPLVAPDVGLAGRLTVADGVLYMGTSRPHGTRPSPPEGALDALSTAEGQVLWRAPLTDSFLGLPVVAHGVVYLTVPAAGVPTLHALSARDGHQLWRTVLTNVTGNLLGSSPAVSDGVVYVGTGYISGPQATKGALDAFRASDGHLLWHTTTDGWVGDTPVAADGMVYATSAQQTVYAFDAGKGTLRWRSSLGTFQVPPGGATLAVAGGGVYAGRHAGGVFALDARNGTRRWLSRPLDGPAGEVEGIVLTLLVAGETVYVGTQRISPFPLALGATSAGGVHALNSEDMIRLTAYQNGMAPLSPQLLGGTDGAVFALNARDGARLWTFHDQNDPPFSPLLLGP